ncbi:hypothetical protein DB88DRAFT_499920 [Papiliotrema laurentii]|uniref:Uncharacterized protein n=1 Tax=Papiliotrema laurentii TaxID=5418 RepID=A0AAD9FPY3_PAPLA|nr:hypothetical protein DB88DRAFT_499920 [Papiliotrema laurentii]
MSTIPTDNGAPYIPQGGSEKSETPTVQEKSTIARIGDYLGREIDSKQADLISIYACFLTGFTSAISFGACFIWCGFQTGNVAQLGLAIARTFNPAPYGTDGFQRPDQQALCSLLTFIIGASLGRLGDRIGPKKRTWLVSASFFQALLAMAGALAAHFSGESGISLDRDGPSWVSPLGFVALGFLSASLGLQGIIGKRVASPLNTTIVLTTTWVEIWNDPFLLKLGPAPSRDVRVAGVFMVFLGAFASRAFVGTRCGVPGSIGILVGLRLVQVVWWALVKSPAPKNQ